MAKSLYDFCIERDEFELLAQWDKQKNGTLTPRDVTRGSHTKVWWKCALGHSWQAVVYSRTGQHTGCPYCAGQKRDPTTQTMACENPEWAKEWHPVKNGDLTPYDVNSGSNRRVWWQCERGHEWTARVRSRVFGAKCPVCSNHKVLIGFNDLGTTHPEIAAQWHSEKNGTLTPESVVYGNYRKVWWRCEKGHEWEAAIISRTRGGTNCPVCAGQAVMPGVNDLASQKPHIAAQWHPTKNGTLTPNQVTPGSNRKVWWVCDKGHEYCAYISHRGHDASGCPYCNNKKVLAGFNDLATIEPKIAAQWHPELNGELTPQMVTAGSRKKVWWQCSEGHVWAAMIYSRAASQKCGCPVCAGKVKNHKQIRYAEIVAEGLQKKK